MRRSPRNRSREEQPSSLPIHTSNNKEAIHEPKYRKNKGPRICQSRLAMWGTTFVFLLSCASILLATNPRVGFADWRSLLMEAINPSRALNQSSGHQREIGPKPKPPPQVPPITNVPARRNWAYAFFLGGVPTLHNETSLAQAGYKGLLYNILVSVKILRDSGSHADMILMVHMAEPYASLSETDAQMLQKLNITTYYVPPTLVPSPIDGISTISLEKFRILDFLQYSRILYLEGDVMPHCNLDYLFELSEPAEKGPLLQENLVISIENVPVTSSIFMLKPNRGHYQRFLRVFETAYPNLFESFNQTKGWGRSLEPPKGEAWLSVLDSSSGGERWNFPGADLDRGLLYHWVRFLRKKVSIVVGNKMVHFMGNDRQTIANPLREYSCLGEAEEQAGGIGNQWYADQNSKKLASPSGQAPYRDFAQWEHNDNKPWNYMKAPDATLQSTQARQRWFEVLRQLDQEHDLQLGLYDPHKAAPKEAQGESLNAEVPNWKYIPKQKPTDRMPIWSTKVHALQQWAKQQNDSETRERLWQPPLLTMPPDAHREHLFAKAPVSVKTEGAQPVPCNCSNPILLDPCSLPDQSIEDWLQPRLGLQFSKHRPACPDGARHHMHVVLPFANLNLDMVQAAYCSVQCQDYPTNKMTIYVYEDGSQSKDEASPPSEVLQHICGDEGVLEVQPPVSASDVASDPKTDEEFDAVSQKWAGQTMEEYSKMIEPKRNAMVSNTICLHSNEHSGPGGGKYWAFRLVQARAKANDVVVVLDGDDELNTPKALQVINRRYVEKSAWMTYGSYVGKYSDQTKGIPKDMLEGKSTFNPRQDQPSWRFGHTRTFKAHLLRHVGRKDFAFKDNSWLVKATDRGFVYRMLELSGPDRVQFIKDDLYKYKWSSSSSTVASIPKEIREANLKHVQSLEPSTRMNLPIHIVIVCWSRVYLLKDQLVWLQEQTLAQNRQLIIHLLSNNPDTHPEVVTNVDDFRKKQEAGSFPGTILLQIKVSQQEENWHAFSRFLYVNELRKTEPMDLVVFVDDDQYWVPSFLSSLLSYHSSRGMTTWYGKTFSTKDAKTGMADYWTSDITWSDIVQRWHTEITTFTYGGPGGSVFDSNIWLFDEQLLRLKYDLKHYYAFDDVWSSYVLDALLGWEQRRLPFPLPVDIANFDHHLYDVTIKANLPKEQAKKLRQMNQDMAARLKAVATYSGGARGSKTDMFIDMQRQFRWDVLRPIDAPMTKKSNDAVVESNKQIGMSPFMPTKPPKKPKRAFVCVTGQFERLELQNKIDNLFRPIADNGYKLQIALVLSRGGTSYTNDGYAKLAQFRPKEREPFFKSFPEATEELQKNELDVISPKDESHGTYRKLANPKTHRQYLMALYEIQNGARSFEQQKERAQNHPRIYESYQRCLAYAENAVAHANEKAIKKDPEWANNPYTLQTYYDVFFRIRDDVGFQEKLSNKIVTSLLEPPPRSVTVTGCRGWHGMNDRFASVSPDVAHTYFNRPYEIFAKEEDLKDHVVFNPETFLLYSFLTAGIHVYANKELRGITRMYKNPETGKAAFYEEDLQKELCMFPNKHKNHVVGLYGWTLP